MSKRFAAAAIALGLAACSGGSQAPIPSMRSAPALLRLDATGAGKIKHVVYIIQENRSFDNLFQGYPGADTVSSGKDSRGKRIALVPVPLTTVYSLDHSGEAMFTDCNGTGPLPGTKCRMNGFTHEAVDGPPGIKHAMYVYVPHAETKPYFEMAHEWVLADRMFQSQVDDSFVAHQYVIAAQAHSSLDLPFGPWGCSGGKADFVGTITQQRTVGKRQEPCFNYTTLGDELDAAHLSWRFYTSVYSDPFEGIWSGYQAVRHIFNGPDWKTDVITPQIRFLRDVRHGKLANFTWITPECTDSDHPGCGGGFGPSWVTSLVNVVGQSKFWDSTAIFVQWDDWGGLYDHVPPPFKDYDSLGFRVPLLVISPYAKKDHVSHVQYETASVLRFAEDLFGLNQLAAADARATSPAADCFDFSRGPRTFVKIKAPKDAAFFARQPADLRMPDRQ